MTPTEPGWYWYRLHPGDPPTGTTHERPAWVVVYVEPDGQVGLPGSDYPFWVSEARGEWGSRIPTPDEWREEQR